MPSTSVSSSCSSCPNDADYSSSDRAKFLSEIAFSFRLLDTLTAPSHSSFPIIRSSVSQLIANNGLGSSGTIGFDSIGILCVELICPACVTAPPNSSVFLNYHFHIGVGRRLFFRSFSFFSIRQYIHVRKLASIRATECAAVWCCPGAPVGDIPAPVCERQDTLVIISWKLLKQLQNW